MGEGEILWGNKGVSQQYEQLLALYIKHSCHLIAARVPGVYAKTSRADKVDVWFRYVTLANETAAFC